MVIGALGSFPRRGPAHLASEFPALTGPSLGASASSVLACASAVPANPSKLALRAPHLLC
jgi:hypothetical protein